ncbi:universal stress protein [Methylibium sp.]|uniref:universal stress protein n=1 Tax=Methylibium sp. TaxID=2067992 RepID=UPI001834E600|nr:universal stress protein [Methylibium sp.]MBA3590580.1 universal stress protein [Methylibium sp.]
MKPDDRELSASIHDFEAALSAKHFELKLPALDVILAAIDGSNQSAMVLGLAAQIARRASTRLHVAYIHEGAANAESDAFLSQQVARLVAEGIEAVALAREPDSSPPYARIIAAADALDADLVIVSAPFLEDFAALGSDSIGVTLDKLMTQARPLLVVREPRDDPAESLKPVLLPLSVHVQENPLAAAWALRLIGDGGTIRLVAVVEDDVIEAAAELIGEHGAADLDLDHLARLDRPEVAGLIAEMHRQAQKRSLGCHVSVRRGDLVAQVIELAEEGQRLIVTGRDTDPGSSSYRNVQALIRRARDPVLVV